MNLQHIIVGCTLVIFGHFILCHGIERTITINGGWSPWSTVATPCLREDLKGKQVLVTCGGGKMTRKRSCTNPVPQVRSLHVIGIGFNLFIFSCQMRCPREQFFFTIQLNKDFLGFVLASRRSKSKSPEKKITKPRKYFLDD